MSDWKHQGRWPVEHLAARLENDWVMVAASDGQRFNYSVEEADGVGNKGFAGEIMAFAEARKLICGETLADRHYYLMQRSIPDEFPQLMPDIVVPRWIEDEQLSINLWFGSAGNVTPLHFDVSNNLFAQLHGCKRMVLFSPHDTPYLSPYPVQSNMRHVSNVDAESPDTNLFPAYAHAAPISLELNAGELLFLPAYWWHQVRSLTASISINFWWQPTLEQSLKPNALRELPGQFKADGLRGFRDAELTPNGLDFATAAAILRDAECRNAAVLVAAAAVTEALTKAVGTPKDARHDEQWWQALFEAWKSRPEAAASSAGFETLQRYLPECLDNPEYVPPHEAVRTIVQLASELS
jgi:jumonji domain-containing protein 7